MLNRLRPQRLRDGTLDPLGRGVEEGFAIVVKDAAGQSTAWAGQLFDTEDAANVTAARCVPRACDVRPARRISFFGPDAGRFTKPRFTLIID